MNQMRVCQDCLEDLRDHGTVLVARRHGNVCGKCGLPIVPGELWTFTTEATDADVPAIRRLHPERAVS